MLFRNLKLVAFVGFTLLLGCNEDPSNDGIELDSFQNILDYSNSSSESLNIFFDKGSWFGVGHNSENQTGFSGPYMLSDSNGYWLEDQILTFNYLDGNNKNIEIVNTQNYSRPGIISQAQNFSTTKGSFKVNQNLFFVDHQTGLLIIDIENDLTETLILNINSPKIKGSSINSKNRIQKKLSSGNLNLFFDQNFSLRQDNIIQSMSLTPSKKQRLMMAINHCFDLEENLEYFDFSNAETQLKKNKGRWKGYLKATQKLEPQLQTLYGKCVSTLIGNWRSNSGSLKHSGLFPSYAYRGFHGIWSWDSWKHAVALAKFNPDLAKDQILSMYDFQDEHGMIADCVFRDTTIENHNWRDTKPPLSGWAIYSVLKETNDLDYGKYILPRLLKYHNWWYENRDHNQNGFCEYGSTDGTWVAARWESGMDNAVRFDSSSMIKTKENAWSLNQESVDLNAYLYAEKIFISKIAAIIGNDSIALKYESQAESLLPKLRSHFFDSDTGYFFDVNTENSKFVKHFGPEAWIMLWAQVASKEQAEKVAQKLMDTKHFNSLLPFPTLSVSDEKFNPEKGYWRGPVWIDQAFFALEGLRNYGFVKEAEYLQNKLINNAQGLLEKGKPIRENYHPITGEGLNAHHFSWSAAHYLLLLD